VKTYSVYIMASASGVLYIGVTNDLERRVFEHKHKRVPGFSARYNIQKLVYFETFGDVRAAIAREKQLKGWLRS
jgi:putative endonuclease